MLHEGCADVLPAGHAVRRGRPASKAAPDRHVVAGRRRLVDDGDRRLARPAASCLLQADRRGETGRPGPDDEDVDGACNASGLPSRGSSCRDDRLDVADDAEVRVVEDPGPRVLVDRHHRLRALHPGDVLDRAGDPDRDVEPWVRRSGRSGRPGSRGWCSRPPRPCARRATLASAPSRLPRPAASGCRRRSKSAR